MKKFFIFTILAFTTLISCQKDAATKSSEHFSNATSSSISSSSQSDLVTRVDLTGNTFHNECTGEELTIISGIATINTTQSWWLRSLNIDHFVLQSSDGTAYRGVFAITFEPIAVSTQVLGFTNTYKLIMTTPGGGNNSFLQSLLHISGDANGNITAYIDNFTAGCQ